MRKRQTGVLQVAAAANQARYRSVKLRQQPLADGPLALQRFLVPAGFVEPDQRRRQIDERNPPRAGHLKLGQRVIGDRLLPLRRNVAAAADLGDGARARACRAARNRRSASDSLRPSRRRSDGSAR